jgi:hypothetical protein
LVGDTNKLFKRACEFQSALFDSNSGNYPHVHICGLGP